MKVSGNLSLLTFFERVRGSCRAEGAGARWTGGQFRMQLLKGSHGTTGSGLGLGLAH